MRSIIHLAVAALIALPALAQQLSVTTLAGSTSGGGHADGRGDQVRFSMPHALVADNEGNLYVSDRGNHVIRKVSPSGEVTTLAGRPGVSGSTNGPANVALFFFPAGITIDPATGNLYVADSGNHLIRRITPAGVVSTFAGSGQTGSTNGTGTAARFTFPQSVAYDPAGGTLYVADTGNHAIRKITSAGVVTTLAGTATVSGPDDGFGTQAEFDRPFGIALDPSSGNLYVADAGNEAIRKVTPEGRVTTFAGTPNEFGTTDGTGSAARFDDPWGLTVDRDGNVWVADTATHIIRRITPAAVVTTVAGAVNTDGRDGTGTAARFNFPTGIAVEPNGTLVIADRGNHAIRRMTTSGVVTTVAGSKPQSSTLNATGTAARFRYPLGVAADAEGNVYAVEANCTLRKIDRNGVATTLAGAAAQCGFADGTGAAARFRGPSGVTVDPNGNIFIADTLNHAIRKVTPAGVVTTFAGVGGSVGRADGTGAQARFDEPWGIASDSRGNLYVADSGNFTIRMIEPTGVVTTFAGSAGNGSHLDGVGSGARFLYPTGIAVDAARNLYVADYGNDVIRKITQAGQVTTLAGRPQFAGFADGTGNAARFDGPTGLAATPDGTLYVADTDNHVLRRVSPAGEVTTAAGLPGSAGNVDGTGRSARFDAPYAVAVAPDGRVIVADTNNHNIRVARATAPVIDFFRASPEVIVKNGSSILSWSVTGATTVTIDHGIGTVSATGSRAVTLQASRTYTLTATGPGGTVTAQVRVGVTGEARRRGVRH